MEDGMEIDTTKIDSRYDLPVGDEAHVKEAQRADLMRLVLSWEHSARKQFECGERTEDQMGKRLVEHGAVVYCNCANDLRKYLFDS
jgi:hypothetical protein